MKQLVLYFMKYTGLFALCRILMAGKIRILCYHGISLRDENRFNPLLWMTKESFRHQMEILKRGRYPVVSLDAVSDYLDGRSLPKHSTVITFDDGWYGTYKYALDVLTALGFPATIYVTSYYAERELPIFNLLVFYVFWATKETECDLGALGFGLAGRYDLADKTGRRDAAECVRQKDLTLGPEDRNDLAHRLAKLLNVDLLSAPRFLELMTGEEIRSAAEMASIDIQLHTHRHSMYSNTRDVIVREIDDNRRALEPLVKNDLRHFCYPSGNCDPKVWPYLDELGVETATTCKSGYVSRKSHKLGLNRILISDTTPDVVFEAELCGALEVFRRLRGLLNPKTA